MSPAATRNGREVASRRFLVTLVAISIFLLGLVVWPFWQDLFLAAVFAGALDPLQERLSSRLGQRRHLTALVLTLGLIFVVLIPVVVLGVNLGQQAAHGFTYVRDTLRSEGATGLVGDLPPRIRPLAEKALGYLTKDGALTVTDAQQARVAAAFGSVLQTTSSILVHVSMMLIALFFLLTDGRRLVDWLCEASPLPDDHTRGLLLEFRKVSVSVLVSSTATAAIQSLVAFVGYWIAGVPQRLFFTAVTFVLAFVPAAGAATATVATAVLLLLTGNTKGAVFLALWGMLAVGLSDNAIKPLLIRIGTPLHAALIFFALFGGLAAFGGVGLLAGPLVLVFFLAVLRMWRRE